MNGTHTKGAAIRSFLQWYQRRHGERMRRAAEAVPPEHRHLVNPDAEALGVLPSLWYPSELVHALIDEMTAGMREEELHQLAEEGSRVIISESLRGVYKTLFVFLVSPQRYAKNAQRLWKVFHDSGTSEIELVGPSEHRLRISGWGGHHPFICRLQRASTAVLYGEMKCKNVVLTSETCVSHGGNACVARIVWST